jgi:WS/DGAT/MGAT family acyltransferase
MARARLTSLDASFLRVETESAHMHIAWKGRFRPRAFGGRPTVEELRTSITSRLDRAPRFRQRLAFTPGSLAEPSWIDDDAFAVERHVLQMGDAPLAASRFDELCDVALSRPLDRGRPLWEVHLAPRVDDGSVGLLMKIHHAMVDGKSAVELALLLLDVSEDARPLPAVRWEPSPPPSPRRLALDALADRGSESLRAAGGLARLAANPRAGVRIADTLRRTALAVGEDMLRPAPSSYVNVPIGPRRTLVSHTAALEPLLEARTRLSVTFNDLALTAVSGALRDLSMRAGHMPEPLKVMVPVSTRSAEEERRSTGNRIAFVFIELPVDLHRASERLERIHAETTRFKRTGRASGGEAILGALGLLPEPLKDRAARLAASPRMYNLTISNVPGPRFPVFLLGCELVEAVPVIPLSDGHALAVGIFTHHGRVTIGAYADPTALPAVRSLPSALNASLLETARLPGRQRRALRSAAA